MRYFYNTLLNGLFLLTINLMFIPFEGFSIQNPNTLDKQEEIYLKNIDSLKYKYIHGKCIALCKKASLKYPKNAYLNMENLSIVLIRNHIKITNLYLRHIAC